MVQYAENSTSFSIRGRRERMTQSIRTHLVVITALGAVLLGVAFLLLHLTGPSDGARLSPGQPVWRPAGVVVTPLRSSGLRQGDVVVAVEGKSMESWAQGLFDFSLTRPQRHIGQTITYTVLRNGRSMDIPVTLGPYPLAVCRRDAGVLPSVMVSYAYEKNLQNREL